MYQTDATSATAVAGPGLMTSATRGRAALLAVAEEGEFCISLLRCALTGLCSWGMYAEHCLIGAGLQLPKLTTAMTVGELSRRTTPVTSLGEYTDWGIIN
jgi:hypothetical protein